MIPGVCVVCQCTEDRACPGGCAWRPGFGRAGIDVCTRCAPTITFPMPVNLANARLHWKDRAKLKAAWQQKAIVIEPFLRGKRPPMPLAYAEAEAVLRLDGTSLMDQDNAVARLKWCLDLLVSRGWLFDDGPAHLLLRPVRQVLDRTRAPVITITLYDEPLPIGVVS